MRNPRVEEILKHLAMHRVRVTYQALGDVMGTNAQSVRPLLDNRRPLASWVVSKATGHPTGYTKNQIDPNLTDETELITTGEQLQQKLDAWGIGRKNPTP